MGEVRQDDRLVTDVDRADRDVTMMLQSDGLYPHLTVARNVRYPQRVRPVFRARHAREVDAATRMVGPKEFRHRRLSKSSGGQRQSAARARATVHRPSAFLMDIPLGARAAKRRVSTRAQINNLQAWLWTATVYVNRDRVEMMTTAIRSGVAVRPRPGFAVTAPVAVSPMVTAMTLTSQAGAATSGTRLTGTVRSTPMADRSRGDRPRGTQPISHEARLDGGGCRRSG